MARSTKPCLKEFQGQTLERLKLLARARKYHIPNASGNFRRIHVRDLESVAGFVVLQLHLDWEAFLEATYLRFLCGWTDGSGAAPVMLAQRQLGLNQASILVRTIVRKQQTITQAYASWTRSNVETRAKKHFQGGDPFVKAFQPAGLVIEDFYAVRNRLAHRSSASVAAFQTVVRRELGRMPRGITPGRFLLATNRAIAGGFSYLDTYARTLAAVAQSIAG